MAVTVARLEAILSADTGNFDRAMKQVRRPDEAGRRAGQLMGGLSAGARGRAQASPSRKRWRPRSPQTRLETAFKGANVSIKPYTKSIEQAAKAAINLGFDDEDLKDSIGSLIIATGDYKKAQEASTVAMDLARFKGISLEARPRRC